MMKSKAWVLGVICSGTKIPKLVLNIFIDGVHWAVIVGSMEEIHCLLLEISEQVDVSEVD